jgi:anthraniloyl-CoA monooxygenase
MMRIVCIGGGAAGLYAAISLKLRDPKHEITVVERNKPYDTFGWGVVFSDETLGNLRDNDPKSAEQIIDNFAHWDDIDVHFKGRTITSSGHGFVGLGRKRMLNILQDRARELGIELVFETEVDGLADYAGADLIIAADGINSKIRKAHAETFQPHIETGNNKFVWLGTHQVFDAFTFIFEQTEHGWIWAHAYRFEKGMSTFIVECDESTWRGLGFDRLPVQEGIELCERIFARYLGGNRLINNATHVATPWLNFPVVTCENWRCGNIILMGDSAHSAHFSVGSGTKLALEDAIELANQIDRQSNLDTALAEYQDLRHTAVLRLQNAARNSTQWFETVPRYAHFDPMQFAYSLLTRSQRVSHENLRLRDKPWLESMERWFASRASGRELEKAVPPMFAPFRLREMELANRIVVSPMAMYSAQDGTPNDFHLVHWGSRALGGAGMVYTEMTCVSPEGRISPGCCGMYSDEHVQAWQRIVDFVHRQTSAKFALQLGHSGPKGSTRVGWEGGDRPLGSGNWEVMAPSPVPWSDENQIPREMTRDDMIRVRDEFVRSAEMAEECGFDMLELHCAHGYLLSAFITPLTNRREDEYGGSLANQLRYPLEVFAAVRAVWPAHKPMSVRISSTDWVPDDGITADEAVEISRAFVDAGVDIIDVSAGQTSVNAKPVYGRMFQTPLSDRIRNELDVATMAVGNIYELDHVNSILAAGRADLCCLARPHLADPYWTLHAAAELGCEDVVWPNPYLGGRDQLIRNIERERQMAAEGG